MQQAGRGGDDDPANLKFAADEGRVLLTHDKRLIPFVTDRISAGSPMPGVFVIHRDAKLGRVVKDLLDLTLLSLDDEWEHQVLFIPFG